MSWSRYLLLPLLAVPPLLLTGALSRPTPGPAHPPTLDPGVSDPDASRLLDQAVARLQPEQMPWVRADVWQRVTGEDFTYQSEGRLLTGPDHRLRLELVMKLGRTQGRLLAVSDGTTLWQSTQVEGMPRQVTRIDLRQYFQFLAQSAAPSQLRADLLGYQGLTGLAPLLQDLQRRMVVTGKETLTWNGKEVIRLALAWSPPVAAQLVPEGQPWPAYLLRKCNVYLDPASLWPIRLECWGPLKPRGRDFPILQLEYRRQEGGASLSAADCAREFAFDLVADQVPDVTREFTDSVQEGIRQLGSPKPPGDS